MAGQKTQAERLGVAAVGYRLVDELGWYPQEPVQPDYGIDAYVELADKGVPNGRMLALQIKSGASWFKEQHEDGFVYRGELRHLEYWLGHALPVVLVLYNPEDECAYWVAITTATVERTETGWKVTVPRNQHLDADASDALQDLAEGDPYILRLNRLRSELTWMQLLRDGGGVFVEAEEWINKTSGRGTIRLIGVPRDGGDRVVTERMIFAGLRPYSEVLPALFPWGELEADENYEDWDKDEAPWYDDGLRPYRNEAGEVDYWRLRLGLNDLGKSFLEVDDHLDDT